MTKPYALSETAWRQRREIRSRFQSEADLKGFAIVPDFLCPDTLKALQDFAYSVPMEPFCVYSRTLDAIELERAYGNPNDNFYYLTTHRRMRQGHGIPNELKAAVASSEMLAFLSGVTGLPIAGFEAPGSLTGWGPGDFLGEHCDEGDPARPTKLIVSLSLTLGWQAQHGGLTHYRWLGGEHEIIVEPKSNVATIFQPGDHSVHWVAPISDDAPADRRFTWTLDYY